MPGALTGKGILDGASGTISGAGNLSGGGTIGTGGVPPGYTLLTDSFGASMRDSENNRLDSPKLA